MTVGEFIKALEKFDPNLKIKTRDGDGYFSDLYNPFETEVDGEMIVEINDWDRSI